jgi:hypothetical protein
MLLLFAFPQSCPQQSSLEIFTNFLLLIEGSSTSTRVPTFDGTNSLGQRLVDGVIRKANWTCIHPKEAQDFGRGSNGVAVFDKGMVEIKQ